MPTRNNNGEMRGNCNIPIFIPELACPHRCIFCNQEKISGTVKIPTPNDVAVIVDTYLKTIPYNTEINIAFFGGNFTGIPIDHQIAYLQVAKQYVKSNKVHGIRISTRPDYIDKPTIERLKSHGVSCIELGAQSFNNRILQNSGRGHSVQDIVLASSLIKENEIELGLQMMIGLPGDTLTSTLETANKIIENKADNSRIYPTLVIKGTPLEDLYLKNKYKALDLETAVSWSSEVYKLFRLAGINVLRVGLHPSDEFQNGSLIAGPYHSSFKELVLSKIWKDRFESELPNKSGKLTIETSHIDINHAIGFGSSNKKWLKEKYGWIKLKPNDNIEPNEFHAYYC